MKKGVSAFSNNKLSVGDVSIGGGDLFTGILIGVIIALLLFK